MGLAVLQALHVVPLFVGILNRECQSRATESGRALRQAWTKLSRRSTSVLFYPPRHYRRGLSPVWPPPEMAGVMGENARLVHVSARRFRFRFCLEGDPLHYLWGGSGTRLADLLGMPTCVSRFIVGQISEPTLGQRYSKLAIRFGRIYSSCWLLARLDCAKGPFHAGILAAL